MTGGGAVVRRDVPPGNLAVSGGPQRNLDRRMPRDPEQTSVGDATTDEGES
jgi:bifunctional UDP-N-acetylglucosamine pyrophosphorylase/glucosamine-1-phosphate N-acetyltransferase